jgi:lysophospholipase L1-like esterase
VEAIVASASKSAELQSAASGDTRKKPRILVIGDSLVSGVGGEASWKSGSRSGPPLPRHIARALSEKWNADVQWNTMSLTGGDVRMLKRKIMPMLKRERAEREEGSGDSAELAAVVLVTGVNDWKRMSPLRTPSKFRNDLRDFIKSIREEVGQNCHVFLPAIPGVHHAPRFHYPLRSFLIFINDTWDAQKAALARTVENVHFVGNPPEADWTTEPSKFFCTQDRLHPSELGYTRWGERIAAQIATATEKGRAALLNRRLGGNLASSSAAGGTASAAEAAESAITMSSSLS